MTDLFTAYSDIRDRMLALAREVGPDALGAMVPACPDWSAQKLIAHCVSLPAAIGAGDLPSGDLDAWIAAICAARADRSIDELADEWSSVDDTISSMLAGGGGAVLFDDLVVHEHDLRGAIDRPDHSWIDADVSIPRSLQALTPGLTEHGLGAIEVRCGDSVWRSHDAPTGWLLETDPWESVRMLSSRRTADEVRAAGGDEAYAKVLDAHLPLPVVTLAEP